MRGILITLLSVRIGGRISDEGIMIIGGKVDTNIVIVYCIVVEIYGIMAMVEWEEGFEGT